MSASAATARARISIEDYELPDETHNEYDITFCDTKFHTLLTHTPSFVDQWVLRVLGTQTDNSMIVGLDVEWRPSFNRYVQNPVATIQLCVASHCLVFQLIHSPSVPQSLVDFLAGAPGRVFVGVGIESDAERLLEDYGLRVGNVVELGALAAERLGTRELKSAGLMQLVKEVLGKEVEKPKRVTMSRWDNPWLNSAQVQYAALDAFLSYQIGNQLNAVAA